MAKKRKSRSDHYYNAGPTANHSAADTTAQSTDPDGDHKMGVSPSLLVPPPLPKLDITPFNLTGTPSFGGDGPTATPMTAEADGGGQWYPAQKKRDKRKKQPKPPGKSNYPEICLSPQRLKRQVTLHEIQGLVAWLVADGVAQQWVLVKHKPQIRRVVVLMVPGLTMDMFDGSLDLTPNIVPDGEEELGAPVDRDANRDAEELEEGEEPEENPYKPGASDSENDPESYYPLTLDRRRLAPCLQGLADIFPHVWPVKAPGDNLRLHSSIAEFLNIKLSNNAQPSHKNANQRVRITQLTMSIEELNMNEYVLHSQVLREQRRALGLGESDEDREALEKRKQEGWVETDLSKSNGKENEAGSVTEGKTIYALDCEMCKTEDGFELTRISILDWDGETVYDELVKPTKPILDYVTAYSGITKEILENVTTTLADVQAHLLKLFDNDTILIGQSLNGDLAALKLVHPHIVDTSVIYHHPRGPPQKLSLKALAQRYLHKEIQNARGGHDSVEDGLACLDLVKLKIERGLDFGTVESQKESIFERFSRNASGPKTGAVIDYARPDKWHPKARKAICVTSDQEVVENVIRCANGDPKGTIGGWEPMDFVWGRLKDINNERGWDSSDDTNSGVVTPPSEKMPKKERLMKAINETVARVKRVHDECPPCTTFIVYTGNADPREYRRLLAMYKQYRQEFKIRKWDELTVQWTDAETQELSKASQKVRKGLGFMVVT